MKNYTRADSELDDWILCIFRIMATALLLTGGFSVQGVDWPQYRGAGHDGVSTERILKQWPIAGPTVLWRVPLLDGFSSFAVSNGKAYTLMERYVSGASREACIAIDAETGAELWARVVGLAQYNSGGNDGASGNKGGDGPRSTPTVDGGFVYALSAYLELYCFDAETGQQIWSRDLENDFGGRVITWQNSASPLIDGDLIFINCNASGQTLVALHKSDGALAWKGHSDKMTHATPVAATIHGVRQIIFFTQSGLVSVLPQTGQELWRYQFPYSTSTAASPVVAGDIVYCSAGYGVGAGAVRITRIGNNFYAAEIWRKSGKLMNHWSTPVHHDGYLYGLFGLGEYGTGPLKCIQLATGAEMWSRSGFGPGGVLSVDGHILVLGDAGQLILVEANPSAYVEVARVQALAGKCWNAPAISNGRIYARSTTQGVCLDVALEPPPPVRLKSLQRGQDGACRLEIGNLDGSDIEPQRISSLQILATTDLMTEKSSWAKITNITVLSDGTLQFEDPESSSATQRFYMVIENQ